jgi:hypothetical protein
MMKYRIVDAVTGETVRDPEFDFEFREFDSEAKAIAEYDATFGCPFAQTLGDYRVESYFPRED